PSWRRRGCGRWRRCARLARPRRRGSGEDRSRRSPCRSSLPGRTTCRVAPLTGTAGHCGSSLPVMLLHGPAFILGTLGDHASEGFEGNPPRVPLPKGFEGNPPRVPLPKGFEGNPPRVPLPKGFEGNPPRVPFQKEPAVMGMLDGKVAVVTGGGTGIGRAVS